MGHRQNLMLTISLNIMLFLSITGLTLKGYLLYRFLLPVLLLLLLFNRQTTFDFAKKLVSSRYFVPLLIWLAYAVLSLLWVRDYVLAVRAIYFLGLGIMLIGVFHLSPQLSRGLIITTALSAALIVLIGVAEYISGYHLPVSIYWGLEVTRPTSVFRNPNDFAYFLSIYCWLFFAIANMEVSRGIKAGGWLLFLASIVLVPLTGSRGALLALAIQICVLACFVLGSFLSSLIRQNWSRRMLIQALAGFLVIGLVIAALVVVPPPAGWTNSLTPLVDALISGEGMTVDFLTNFFGIIRVNLVKNGLLMFRDSNFLGVGAGNAEAYMSEYSLSHYPVGELTNIHNWWVELAANYGLPGLLAYGFFLSLVFCRLIVLIRKGEKSSMLGKAGIIMLTGFVFAAMSPSSIMSLRVHWIMYGIFIFVCENVPNSLFKQQDRGGI